MKIEFYNCPKPGEIENVKLPETPEFVKYRPDFELIKKLADKYQSYPNILIIAHGGSITSFYGFYNALKYQAKKSAYFLNTVDPDYIFELKQTLKPENTVVIAISKSGQTTTQIEMMSQFFDFPMVVVCGKSSPLRAIADKLGLETVVHPTIGGRFTGLTEVGLLPATIAGLDAEGLFNGAESFYDLYPRDNLAWRAASIFFQLEQKGIVDVFMPFYSHNLFPMSALIVQLCHESFGKAGKGQTYFAHEAPESQHHTNQRFFGGTKNIAGFFTSAENFKHEIVTNYPAAIHSVQIKGRHLADVNKIPLDKALNFELQGTLEDARISGIPVAHLFLTGFAATEVGQMTAFWQLFAVYSSVLRDVDPFDQPQVENSKNISFNKRLQYKGLS
ncbi:MAG: hypothetical protein P4L74_05825 [Candidatus Doudnabacteria bacterium]|nr:hypothetical protein [Candidatus Doudnabacteria bacterium]